MGFTGETAGLGGETWWRDGGRRVFGGLPIQTAQLE